MSWLPRVLRGFGMFWWDLLVGDTPEIFVAVVLALGLVALISVSAGWHAVAVALLPLLATATLVLSVRRAARAKR